MTIPHAGNNLITDSPNGEFLKRWISPYGEKGGALEIGKIIKGLAAIRGVSLASLAKATGRAPSHFSKQINGKRAITTDDLEKISVALGLEPSQIYKEAEERRETSEK